MTLLWSRDRSRGSAARIGRTCGLANYGSFRKSAATCTWIRKVVCNRLPDRLEIDAEVLMRQQVPHVPDLEPGNARGETLRRIVNMPCGFAQHLEVADDGVNGLWIGRELVE